MVVNINTISKQVIENEVISKEMYNKQNQTFLTP